MSLQNGSLRAAAETREQYEALLETEVSLIYIDSGYFAPGSFRALCEAAHAAGKSCGLRFPHIFRKETADFFRKHRESVLEAGFDAFLLRSLEELCFLREEGFPGEGFCGGAGSAQADPGADTEPEAKPDTKPGAKRRTELVADHGMYAFNGTAAALLEQILAGEAGQERFQSACPYRLTLPLELNSRELAALCRMDRKAPHELVVYGRAPMMVSAQCIRKTLRGCDKRPVVMQLKDRKGALLPVKNNCTFCYNTILNAGPTVIYDREKELSEIGADSLRYEFTTETAKEVKEILSGKRIWRENEFTRGHFKRGVE